jgi:spermidine/putrescine transport system substrate-binding protein
MLTRFLMSVLLFSCDLWTHKVHQPEHGQPQKIHLFSWGEYTSKNIFADFKTETGIEVVESNFSSNEELLAKMQAGGAGYDLIIPSDYMVTVMTELKLLAPLDLSKIPNASNIDPALLNLDHDPKNTWSLPYSWSLAGIIFRENKVKKEVTGHGDMFLRDDLKFRFSILDDSREMIGSALKSQGKSVNTTDDDTLNQIKSFLMKIKKRAREFNSTPSSQLLNGDLIAAQIYSNEALRLTLRDGNFRFILPEDGFTMAVDNMAIPANSQNKERTHLLINYLLRPDVNLRFVKDVLAAPVIKGVHEKLLPELRDQPAMGPLDVIRRKSETIKDLGIITKKYDRMWTELKVSDI